MQISPCGIPLMYKRRAKPLSEEERGKKKEGDDS
jgi:hypothetical protein